MCIRDSYVIGQDEAKRVLAVSVYNHYKLVSADGLRFCPYRIN